MMGKRENSDKNANCNGVAQNETLIIKAEVYQFISRRNIDNMSLGQVNTNPRQYPTVKFSIDFELIDKPFEINFAQVIATPPSIGAYEYIDPYQDVYMSKRWPKCIKGTAKIVIAKDDQKNNKVLEMFLQYMRVVCWHLREHVSVLKSHDDQFAKEKAYRREYFCHQIFDFAGNRVPNSSQFFHLTSSNDYIGPGLAMISGHFSHDYINEFVWSQIIPFTNPIDVKTDFPKIVQKLIEMRKQYNTYNELNDSRRHQIAGELKASIRAAASAVDAIIRYYCNLWGVAFPKRDLQFNEKIEQVLKEAGKPSYKTVDQDNSKKLLYLYRARNSMHEGDCYYRDNSAKIIKITSKEQVEDFIDAAEQFTLWIDSIG
jgi:hypothetical protein